MENITRGHIIFGLVSLIAFIVLLIFAYRKDQPLHKIHYSGVFFVVLAIVIIIFLLFVIKNLTKI